jgi:hypothetical protein
MTQDELSEIWRRTKVGEMTGWGAIDHGDIHTIRRLEPTDEAWGRRAPDGAWVLLPPLQGNL